MSETVLSGNRTAHNAPDAVRWDAVAPEAMDDELVLADDDSAEESRRFGDRVQEWRHDSRWTQQRLAEALGYDVSYVAKIEQGRRRPSRQFVARLAEVLAASGQELPGRLRAPSAHTRLPVPAHPVVGRAADLKAVGQLLRGPDRLVTLVGAPGVGKTSLAVEAGWQLAPELRHGACFVALAEVADAASVPAALGAALGVAQRGDSDAATLVIDVLRTREALVVLDNFEHVLEARPFVERLLREAPAVRVLATSREPLRAEDEVEFRVGRLAFPDPAGRTPPRPLDYPAVELFVSRARAVRPGFALMESNVAAIVEICARLDGLPLAIGLAASASVILSPSDIAASLRHRLELPTGDPHERYAPGRLTAALEWSWELLQPGLRILLSHLAVFSGGCTLGAAEAVCAEGTDVLAGLAALARKNLVEVAHADRGPSRFTLLETIRRFCLDRLAADELVELRRRHCAHYVRLAEMAMPHIVGGSEQARWLRILEEEYGNAASAFAWALDNDPESALRLGAAMWRYFSMRRVADGRSWLGAALHAATDGSVSRVQAQIGAAVLARQQADGRTAAALLADAIASADRLGAGAERALAVLNLGIVQEHRGDLELAEASFREAQALSLALGDERGAGHALNCLGVIALHRGDTDAASALFLEALGRFRALDDAWSVAVTTTNLGWIAETNDALDEAQAWYDESSQIWEAVGDEHGLARSMADAGRIVRRQGKAVQAATRLQGALRVFERLGDRRLVAACLLELAAVATQRRRRDLAARLVGAAEGLRDVLHTPAWPQERELEERILAELARTMDAASRRRGRAVGRTLSVEDAVELAECGTWPPPVRRARPAPQPGPLGEAKRRAQALRPLMPAPNRP